MMAAMSNDIKMAKAVESVFQSFEPILRDNAFLLFFGDPRDAERKNALTNPLSWKLLAPVFLMERGMRPFMKKILDCA
jgi:hypothetical protein